MRSDHFAYVEAGAGTEDTVRENRAAFARHRIVPRMLRGVAQPDASVELFGRRLDSPFLLAPVGVLELAHRDADVAVARAARATGVPMIFSNQASRPMEECAEALGRQPALVPALLEHLGRARREPRRARRGVRLRGDRADARHDDRGLAPARPRARLPPVPARAGHRPVHERPGVPPPDGRGLGNGDAPHAAADPAGAAHAGALTRAYPGPFWRTSRAGAGARRVQRFTEIFARPSLSWEDLPFLRERTKLPILLKGILHPDDARRALDAGVDGIVVSNHGGRQVDGAIATLDALPGVVAAVGRARCRCCSTPACAAAPTRSRRSRSARPRC